MCVLREGIKYQPPLISARDVATQKAEVFIDTWTCISYFRMILSYIVGCGCLASSVISSTACSVGLYTNPLFARRDGKVSLAPHFLYVSLRNIFFMAATAKRKGSSTRSIR